MSDIRKKNNIRVFNEMQTQINLVGQYKTYVFSPCDENGNPSMNYVDFADIEFANSRGTIFSSGLLVFSPEEQDEIYNELHINNWKNTVWFNSYIDDAIDHPTVEKMQRIINVTDLITIERIRGKVIGKVNHGDNVSNKVINIIDKRYRELASGTVKSAIVIKAADVQPEVTNEQVDALKQQIAEMQKAMASMMQNQVANVSNDVNEASENNSEEVVENIVVEKPKTSKKKVTSSKK